MSAQIEFEVLSQRRNNFYRNQFRRMARFLMLLIALSGMLSAVLFFLVWGSKPAKYYASTTTGDVIALSPLSAPVVTQKYILQWAELVVRSAYTLNFDAYEAQLEKTEPYFTSEGWDAFNQALKDSKFLDDVIAKKLYLSAVVNGPSVIVNRYIQHGRFTWDVQMPVLISYNSANMTRKRQIYVSMTVSRVPELEDARGIAVTNFHNGFSKNGK